MTVKGELQDPSPRKLKLVTQCLNIRRDDSQIFDNERQVAKFFLHGFEKALARSGHPLSGLSCWRTRGNVPRSCKSAEVIQADRIHVREQST